MIGGSFSTVRVKMLLPQPDHSKLSRATKRESLETPSHSHAFAGGYERAPAHTSRGIQKGL